jgi:hypothetical protein
MDASSTPRHDGNGRRSPQPFPSPCEPGATAQFMTTPKPSSASRCPQRTRMPSQAGSTDALALSPGPRRRSPHARVQRSTVWQPRRASPSRASGLRATQHLGDDTRPGRRARAKQHRMTSPPAPPHGASPRGHSRDFAEPRAPAPHATQYRVATPVTSSDPALLASAASPRGDSSKFVGHSPSTCERRSTGY